MSISKTLPVNRCEFAQALLWAQRNALLDFLNGLPEQDLSIADLRCRVLEAIRDKGDSARLPVWKLDSMRPDVRSAASSAIDIALQERHI